MRSRALYPTVTVNRRMNAAAVLIAAASFASVCLGQDNDGDGVPDGQDICPNTPAGIAVDSDGRPLGDLDLDCDADMDDFAVFQTGFTGPLPPINVEDCDDGIDNDGDGLADCADTADCPAGTPCGGGQRCSQFGGCGCPPGYGDCNGVPEDGCETLLNSNPACGAGQHNFGAISGDEGGSVVGFTGHGERWFRVQITEDSDFDRYLSARVQLLPAADSDYDLYVYCNSCGGGLAGSSTRGPGLPDFVDVRSNDDWGSEDTFNVMIEVRYWSGDCGDYTLEVIGNTLVNNETCN